MCFTSPPGVNVRCRRSPDLGLLLFFCALSRLLRCEGFEQPLGFMLLAFEVPGVAPLTVVEQR
jgi:hypothetical protein